MSDKFDDINALLNDIIRPDSLKDLFDKKVKELDLTSTAVLDIIGIQYRALKGILEGAQKMVDVTSIIKIANFLQIPKEQVFKLFLDEVEKRHPIETAPADKIKFIKENFDLAALKKAGVIDTLTDFNHIEQRIIARLGLKSIFEYRKPDLDIAFSSGHFKPENELIRAFWIKAAIACFEEIDNPYDYDRQELIKFFPQIRWYSMNVERGLLEVVKVLYRLGITVIFQQPLITLQLRGATFSYNEKPCIVLTNYVGFYSTLWFALIHELYHVLFDWEEIKKHRYHLTDDSNEQLSVQEREKEADNFAREYLFSSEKMERVSRYINDPSFIKEFAESNHVHHSIIYAFYAYATDKRTAWARLREYSPNVNDSVREIDFPWKPDEKPFDEMLKKKKMVIYN